VASAPPAAALTCTRTVGGEFTGEDRQRISGFVGIEILDAQGRALSPSNCAQSSAANSGYDYVTRINGTAHSCCFTLGTNGASPDDTRYSNRWEIVGIPAEAAYINVEAYPKSTNGPSSNGFTDYARYGGAMRRGAAVGTNVDIRLPIGVNYGGDNGAIAGRILDGGRGVGVRAIHAFSRAQDRPSPIMGFMSYPGSGAADGSFVVPQLEPLQHYALSFELVDGRQVWYEHDYGTGIAVQPRTTASHDFNLVATAAGWRAVVNFSEPATSGPGAVDVGVHHSVSYRGTDGSLRQRVGSSLVPLGGQIQGAPDQATWFNGRVDVVARGTDNQVYTRTSFDNGASFGGWVNLGGQISGDPSIVAWGNGRLDVFATGTDRQLWHRWSNDGSNWGIWEPLGGVITGSVDASSWGPGRLDVLARGTDGQVWHRFHDGGWSGWIPMGGQLFAGSGPAAASPAVNRFDIVVRGTDNRVYIRSWNGSSWSSYAWLNGGSTNGDPDAFGVLGRTTVYVTGTNGYVYRSTRPAGATTFAGWTLV
jgi:hypothetical protein